jgi:uncharacterized protein
METSTSLNQEFKSSFIYTTLLTMLFLLLYGSVNVLNDLAIALPFFILFYYLFFTLGRVEVTSIFKGWIQGDFKKVLLFPTILLALYFLYIVINGQNPVRGTLALMPYMILFPLLLFVVRRNRSQDID